MAGEAQQGKTTARSTPKPRRRGLKRKVFYGLLALGLAVLAYMAYWGSTIDTRVFSLDELTHPRVQVIAWPGARTAVQASRASDLPADQLWRVIADQERFPQFVPYVRTVTLRRGAVPGTFIENMIMDLPHKTYDVELELRLETRGNVRTARWRQITETLAFNEGAWVVEDHGARSVLRYQLSVSVSWFPDWLVNFVVSRRLNRVLASVDERVLDLQEKEPGYFKK